MIEDIQQSKQDRKNKILSISDVDRDETPVPRDSLVEHSTPKTTTTTTTITATTEDLSLCKDALISVEPNSKQFARTGSTRVSSALSQDDKLVASSQDDLCVQDDNNCHDEETIEFVHRQEEFTSKQCSKIERSSNVFKTRNKSSSTV